MTGSLSEYLDETNRLLIEMEIRDAANALLPMDGGATAAIDLLRKAKTANRTAFIVGNGGSAAIASHMQNDLCKAVGIRALVFTEQPLLTALTNDDGYEGAYETMVKLWAGPGDLLVAISSSGRSKNILRAATAARAAGCRIITLSGFAGNNPLRVLGDVNFYVPSESYGHVELIHAALTQFLTDALKGV
jgi:D-sedoheptulose 7-phosphate isomerase